MSDMFLFYFPCKKKKKKKDKSIVSVLFRESAIRLASSLISRYLIVIVSTSSLSSSSSSAAFTSNRAVTMQAPYFAEAAAAVNSLRDNVHLAGTGGDGVWYYPPTVLDENGRLWGSYADHADRVLENRAALRCYYRSLQPDAPVPSPPHGRAGHVAAIETFVTDLLAYYRPLMATAAAAEVPSELIAQAAVLLAETNVLYNVVLAMRPWTGVTAAAAAAAEMVSGLDETE